jgi:hypothetical protein
VSLATLSVDCGKSTIAGAIRHTLSRWDGLTRFLDDGGITKSTDSWELFGFGWV